MKVTKDGNEQNNNGVVTVTLSDTDASKYAITKSDASGAPELTNLAGTKSAGIDAKFTVTLANATVSIAANAANDYPSDQETYKLTAFGYDEVVFNLPTTTP